jgi:hypothetical protein
MFMFVVFICAYVVCLLSMFINCLFCFGSRKYEEIKPPEVEDFCYITDNTYSREEVILVV